MKIQKIDEVIVSQQKETHYKLKINEKEICVSKYIKADNFDYENDTEIFKGKELLSEEEIDEVNDFINDL